MTWSLKPDGEGSDVVLTYAVGGYVDGGFDDLSKAANTVLAAQLARLKTSLETGNDEKH